MNRSRILLLLLCVAVAVTYGGNTGKIAGVVKDGQTGETLIGVNVLIEGTTMGAATNIDGYYVILNIPPGKYNLTASSVGYARQVTQGVIVSIDQTTTIDISLSATVVAVGEEIVVTAERPLVQKDQTAKTAVVGGDQIAALPVTEVGQVLSLQAGMVAGSLRGGRSGEIAYWIDGVPVTDAFNGSQVVEVNKVAVSELQLVSGAFNAEYGQAMSGIANIAMREGGVKYGGGVGAYAGQYLAFDDSLFPGLSSFKPFAIRNIEANLNGPLLGDALSFFANVRYIYFDGHYKGYNRFNPSNISYTDDLTRRFILYRDATGRGDSSEVSMDRSQRRYAQGKLTWRISPTIKLNTNYIYDQSESKPYNRSFFFNPEGLGTNRNQSHTVVLQFSQTLGQRTFYTIGASWIENNLKYSLYDLQYRLDPSGSGDLIEVVNANGPRYVHPELFLTDDSYSFLTGGTDLSKYKRTTSSKLIKVDLSSQVNSTNLLKVGVEGKLHSVFFESMTLQPVQGQTDINLASDSPFIQTRIMPVSSLFHDVYHRRPKELAAYIQDKLEFKDFILNIGVRFDWFDPDGYVLNDEHPDPADPLHYTYTVDDPNIYSPIKVDNKSLTLEQRRSFWYRRASKKWQFSPRLGGSFPITANGMVHFSYGHFFQVPRFERLYENPDFKIGFGTGNQGIVGNADLEPEQTINAEIGVQQALTEDLVADVTAYLRDIRGLTGTRADEIIVFGGAAKYSKYVNSDFGFVKGIIVTLNKRFGGNFSATVDFTYQVARGSASDPAQARNALAGGSLPEVQLLPLSWDQRNTLNVTATYSPGKWGLSMVGQFGSGTPYTPRRSTDINSLLTNSQIKPSSFNVDLRAHYEFRINPLKIVAFARVFNVFDVRNEYGVYDDTGRADFTTDEMRVALTNPRQRINSLAEWFTAPTFYSEPRRIEIGMNLEF